MVPKKRSASVGGSDRRCWSGENLQEEHSAEKWSVLETLGALALPRPAVERDGWALLFQLAAEFLLTFLSFAGGLLLAEGTFIRRGHVGAVLLYGALVTLLRHADGLYEPWRESSPRSEAFVLVKTAAWAALLVGMAARLAGFAAVSLTVLVLSASVHLLLALSGRAVVRHSSARWLGKSGSVRNVLIVGAGETAFALAAYLKRNPRSGRVVKGFLDQSGTREGQILGKIEELGRIARAEFVDEVLIALPHEPELARRAVLEARRNRLDVKVVPDLFGCRLRYLALEQAGSIPLLNLHQESIPALSLALKRSLDLVVAAVCLGLLAPLLGVIALAIKLDSRGPVLYCAPRMGKKGRRFRCYKFRTMVENAEILKEELRRHNERQGPFFKMAGDPRITRVGRRLRCYSLDELPQLWNVLKGEMSLVGPRPHPLDDFARYEPEHLRRLDVTPGVTGLWQVTARKDPSFERNMALDLEYIEKWSLGLDLRILFRTVAVVTSGSGA
jgi:exopolysaccharide biosynthesis polyprenyl glycosylphosphotransferase